MSKMAVEVTLKNGILDPEAKTILETLHNLGFSSVKNVKQSKKYYIELSDDKGTTIDIGNDIAKQILANPVMEDFKVIDT